MRSKLRSYLLLLIVLFSKAVLSQSLPFAFNVVAGSKDVSLVKINGITQDSWGYMWFVDNGNRRLVRYDGYSMKVFEHDPADTNSLNVGAGECIAADSSGNVWSPVQGGVDEVTS